MVFSHSLPTEHSNKRRRHKRLRDFLTILAIGGLAAGCEANAKNETTKTPASPQVAKLTVDGCAKITVQADMIECFEKLNVQQQAEIDAKRKALESEQGVNKLRRKRVDELAKESEEAMKRLEDRILEPER